MKKLALIIATLVMGAVVAQAETVTTIGLQLCNKVGLPNNSGSDLGTLSITSNTSASGGDAQNVTYKVVGLTLDSVGSGDDEITFTMGLTGTSSSGSVLGFGVLYGAWGVSDGTGTGSLVETDETLAFSFDSATVTLGAGATEDATIEYNGMTGFSALHVAAAERFNITGTASNDATNVQITANKVLHNFIGPEAGFTVAQTIGAMRYHMIQTSVTITTVPGAGLNEFTGTVDDTWATAANWANTVPSAGNEAIVNSNLTANLSGGSGNAKYLHVGTTANQSGTVSNGSLTVVNATRIGAWSNAVGVVELTEYTAGTTSDDVAIGTGELSSGSLVAGLGTLTANALALASGENSIGTLSIPALNLSDESTIGAGTSSSGTVAVTSLNVNSQKFGMASGSDSYASLVATTSTTMGSLTMGIGSNSVAVIDVPSLTSVGNVYTTVGQDSTVSLLIDTHTLSGGANYNVGQARDSSATIEGSTGAGTTLDFTGSGGSIFIVNRGSNSVSNFTLTTPIAMNSTNTLEIGTGLDSSHNLLESDFAITGPIGSFYFGDGTGVLTNLFNTHNSIGALTVNVPAEVTAQTHEITALTLNANLVLSGGTSTLSPGIGISIATIADSDITLDMGDWVTGIVTSGPINVARGNNALGAMEATDLVLDGALQVGGGGSGNNGTLTVDSLDSDNPNGRDVKIADGGTAATGTVTVAGNVRVGETLVGSGTDAVGKLDVGGSLTITNGILKVATVRGSDGTVTVAGDSTLGVINVGAGVGSMSTLTLAALTNNGTLSVALGDGSISTATMDSLSGDKNLDICTSNTNATGTVTVAGDATISQLRMAIKNNSKATLTVGGTLTIPDGDGTRYFNVASGDDCLVNLTAAILNKGQSNGLSVVKAGGDRSQAYVTANDGTLFANKFEVAAAVEGTALFAVTNGTLEVGGDNAYVRIGTGRSSDGTVLVDLSSFTTIPVNIGTASNAIGRLTMVGSGTVTASVLNLGQTNSGVNGQGFLTLAGGNMVVTGALEVATGSYIDITDSSSSINWDGDFEALWNAGKLRSNGVTGPGNTFGSYFAVVDGVLIETPVGFIAIANAGGGVDISWNGQSGWDYDVKTNGNLMIPGGWGVYSTETGIDGPMSVTVVTGDETFFQVIGRK